MRRKLEGDSCEFEIVLCELKEQRLQHMSLQEELKLTDMS